MTAPLIIIGAPRSGTNALRDALCSLDSFHTWPCDELNPLWRTGNLTHPTDELAAKDARPAVARTIRAAFDRRAKKQPAAVLIEKTCANSLRPEFVHAVIPDARYVEIVRDGRDAASSAVERWGAPFELSYTLRKLRFVPKRDLAEVSRRQLGHRFRRGGPDRAAVRTWGPRFSRLDELIRDEAPLEDICAAQWSACVMASSDFFDSNLGLPALRIRYEDLVSTPVNTLETICNFAGMNATGASVEQAAGSIHAGSVGRWTATPLAKSPSALTILEPGLTRLGYPDTAMPDIGDA